MEVKGRNVITAACKYDSSVYNIRSQFRRCLFQNSMNSLHNLVVDIGAGTSDVAVISLAGVVVSADRKSVV